MDHFLGLWNRDGRVEIANLTLHPGKDRVAPVLEVVGQTGPERLRKYQGAQFDQVRDGVVVERMALAAEPGGFKRDRTTAREQVQDLGG